MRVFSALSVCQIAFRGRPRALPTALLAAGAVAAALARFGGAAAAVPVATPRADPSRPPLAGRRPMAEMAPAAGRVAQQITVVSARLAAGGDGPPNAPLRLTPAGPGEAQCDLGRLVAGLLPPIRCLVELRNDTAKAVTLTRVTSSSGCLRAAVSGDPPPTIGTALAAKVTLAAKPVVVPAGGHVALHVLIDPSALPSGPADLRVWVMVRGQPGPAASLHLTGMIAPALQVSPRALDFGRVSAQDRPSLPLSVSLDPRLGGAVRFSCPDAEVGVAADPPGAGAAAQVYRVTLTPAGAAHRVSSRLALEVSNPRQDPGGQQRGPGLAPMELVMIPVTAEVAGPPLLHPAK